MKYKNEMTMTVKSLSENESFVRSSVAAFCLPLNPTIDEITEIKTAVSEAVTNCVVHAYPNEVGEIIIKVKLTDNTVNLTVTDRGVGIDNLEKAAGAETNDENYKQGVELVLKQFIKAETLFSL